MAGDFEEAAREETNNIPRAVIYPTLPEEEVRRILQDAENGPGCVIIMPDGGTAIPDYATLKDDWMVGFFNSEANGKYVSTAVEGAQRYLKGAMITDKFEDDDAARDQWRTEWSRCEDRSLEKKAIDYYTDYNQLRPNRMTMALGWMMLLGEAANNQTLGVEIVESCRSMMKEVNDCYRSLSIPLKIVFAERIKKHIVGCLDKIYLEAGK